MADIAGGLSGEAGGHLTIVGTRPASVGARIAWAVYEFGGGPYFTALIVFVFSSYFANTVVVGDPVAGLAYWGYVGAAGGILVAAFSPIVGAIADRYGPRKPGIALFTLLALPSVSSLWFVVPGSVLWAAGFVVLSSLLLELAFVFHNAMLPAISPARRIGTLSAISYAMAYAGALSALFVYLNLGRWGIGGGPAHGHAQERSMALIAAAYVAIFVFPLMLFTPDTRRSGLPLGVCISQGLRGLGHTLRAVRSYKNIVTFLVARMLYYDGLGAVFAFVGIFASGVFGWDQSKVGLYALISIGALPLSAVIGGLTDDRIGSKLTIQVSLVAFMISLAANLGTDPTTIWYVIHLTPADIARQLPILGGMLANVGFTTLPEQVFLIVGFAGALFVGPALASSRTLMARLVPPGQVAEFFGLYNLTGRATAALAPLTVGIVTQATGDRRIGLSVIFLFISTGFVLLSFVKEPRIRPETISPAR